MPLVKSTNDGEFLSEVAHTMDEQFTKGRDYISAMIEEYLRLRTKQIAEATRNDCADEVAKAIAERDAETTKQVDTAKKLTKAEGHMARMAGSIADAKTQLSTLRYFHVWMRFAQKRREARLRARQAALHHQRLMVFHVYVQWRLFAASRRASTLQARNQQRSRCKEEELRGQVEVLKQELKTERTRNEELDERLKAAFVRGVCALNREAAHVLHGDGTEEITTAAIEDILSKRDNNSRRASITNMGDPQTRGGPACDIHAHNQHHPQQQRSRQLGGTSRDTVYHRCYDPEGCEYARAEMQQVVMMTPAHLTHEPFLVRADVNAVRTFDAGYGRPQASRKSFHRGY